METRENIYEDQKAAFRWLATIDPKNLSSLNRQQLVRYIWLLSQLPTTTKEQIKFWIKAAEIQLKNYDIAQLSIIIWSLASLQYFDDLFIKSLVHQIDQKIDGLKDNKSMNQVYIACRFYQIDTDKLRWIFSRHVEWMEKNQHRPSGFDEKISALLAEMQYNFKQQVLVSGYYIDFVIYILDKKIALECDGVCYHTSDNKLRDLLIKREGYQIIHLTDRKFNEAPDKKLLIKELINRRYLVVTSDDLSPKK